jgi:Protein of unknown function (DUF664)
VDILGDMRASRAGHPPSSRKKDATPPRTHADELSTLLGFLDYLRDAIASKVEGAPEPQVRTPGVPSGTNLLGLITHLTAVERFVFMGEDVDNWAMTLQPSADDTVEGVLTAYRSATEDANRIIRSGTDLELPTAPSPRRGSRPSMRWALTHMIEETGRHAGHADILRELIDGSTGR